jgi:hypothetical protein
MNELENLVPMESSHTSPDDGVNPLPAPAESSVPPAERPEEPVSAGTVTEHTAHGQNAVPSWRAEAGRKGGRRVHQLIRHGLLNEQEHGLKRGRQRLRQLIQEGKLYEQEHGLRATRTSSVSGPRMGSDQVLRSLFHILQRLVKPSYRGKLAKMLQALEPSVETEKAGGA